MFSYRVWYFCKENYFRYNLKAFKEIEIAFIDYKGIMWYNIDLYTISLSMLFKWVKNGNNDDAIATSMP